MYYKYKKHLKEIVLLALPIAISIISIGLMGIVDTIVVGHYDTEQLAYSGLANTIFVVLFSVPIALLQGFLIKSSQKYGAKKFASCGKIYNEGKKYLILLSVIFTLIGLNGKSILAMLGQNPEMVEHGGEILFILAFSFPFILIFSNTNFFLQSIKRPHIAMYAILIANVINLILDPILVFGMFGIPAMGANGAAIVTVIVRIFLASYILSYIYKMKKNTKLKERFGLDRTYKSWWKDSKNTRKIGIGIGITTIMNQGSFTFVSSFAGLMGEFSMAVFTIIINISTIVFMLCFSISQATSISVAKAYGAKDTKSICMITHAGYILSFILIVILSAIIYLFPKEIFGIFTNDATIIVKIIEIIPAFILNIITGTAPLVLIGALNARGDIKIPTAFQIFAALLIGVTSCYILGFTYDMGIKGLLIGLSFGGVISFLLNGGRFIYLTKKDKKIKG